MKKESPETILNSLIGILTNKKFLRETKYLWKEFTETIYEKFQE